MNMPRAWWRDIVAADWAPFATRDDLAREQHVALLAALEELSTRGPMWPLRDITVQLRGVGFNDPLSEPDLRAALDRLEEWKFVEPFRDSAAPLRGYQGAVNRQESWALTSRGRVVVAAVRAAVTDANRALQLPSKLLEGVEETLLLLLSEFAEKPDRLGSRLNDIRTRIDELHQVAADFYEALARLVQSDVTNDALFGDNRDRVVEALRQFPREYGRALRRVESALAEIEKTGPRAIVEAAVEHAGLLDAGDRQHWVEERVRRLSDLAAWFAAHGSVERLIDSASGAVSTLLVAIDRRYTARRRGADVGADFRALARSIHQQPDGVAARRIYAAGFGDWPSWHARIGHLDDEDHSYAAPAADGARRHTVEVTIRDNERQGRASGVPRRVANTADARAEAIAAAVAEAEVRRLHSAALITHGEVRLDHFADLEAEPAALLLSAIEVAVDRFDPQTGIGTGYLDAAGLVVIVRPGIPGRLARVRLADGYLTGPDLRITIAASQDQDPQLIREAG
ncbi:DUF2397 family protein [Kribbella qitaiheensis]|uniref:DUF2397 family protein n=1 Tax=Kribbella qitaiheensis TaxID=1544730 RepID=A0A7G6WW67_9ACTN|nr:DUF2397 family protein [Kribbella qitaiheensis]QNE18232.1 DUF2397 family protein [Kribbella qitaiheensis]